MSVPIYYFGSLSAKGDHFLRAPGQKPASADRKLIPWPDLDAALCPGFVMAGTPPQAQVEGKAKLHHKDGWTALAFWDRSLDTRYGSNSAFFAPGKLDFSAIVTLAKTHFPDVWARFPFQVRVEPQPKIPLRG